MHFGNISGWGMGFWWIGGLIMMGLFIWLIFNVLDRNRNNHIPPTFRTSERPLDILKKRYAGGEISKEEFDKISNELL